MNARFSRSTILRALALTTLLGCGGAPAVAVAPPPKAKPAAPPPEAIRAERPLTPGKVMLMTDYGLSPDLGDTYRHHRGFALAAGGVGFLDTRGSRAIATLAGVRKIDGPVKLGAIYVASDGKTTFATSQESGEALRIWRADAFDATPTQVGSFLAEPRRGARDVRPEWIVSDDKLGTSLVDAETGKVEAIGPPSTHGRELHFTAAIQILELTEKTKSGETDYCLVRRSGSAAWVKYPACYVQSREDGTLVVETRTRTAHVKPTCLLILDEQGKDLGCKAPLALAARVKPSPGEDEPALALGRFYAPSKAVIPSAKQGLFRVGGDGKIEAAPIAATAQQMCAPLLPTMPLFHCTDEAVDTVVNVDAAGQLHEELRRRRAPRQDPGASRENDPAGIFQVTSDGGVAIGGDCSGGLGNVACLRTPSGAWHDVPFSKDLIAALNRTAPSTRMVPTPEGKLYVGTATSDGLLGGNIRVFLFRADQGAAIPIEKIPAWILGSLSGIGNIASLLGASNGRSGAAPSLSWSRSQWVRLWPLEREHPAFHTKEFCRVDIGLDGTFDTECVQGRLFAVGRVGLWEKRPGELLETLDAGESWAPIALPKGADSDDTVCSALGCRIGPYWRMGWGSAP